MIEAGSGGHFTASNSTFTLTELSLDAGSVLNAGDLVGDTFDLPLYLPAADVQDLSGAGSNNLSFQDIDILGGSIGSGQTLALNAIGTASTANLRYVFSGAFTVGAGATLTVAPNVSVLIQAGQTLTDDGTVSFGNGDAVSFGYVYGTTTKILVGNGGVMSAANTIFSAVSVSNATVMEVGSGGHFTASNSTFTLTELSLDAGSILNAGDLVGDTFNLPLYLPAADVQDLSGTGSDNQSFQDIDILAGSIGSGQTLALNAIGTATTANLRYVFSGAFTVGAGATLTVAPNVSVLIQAGQTLTDDGTVSFGNGDAVSFGYAYGVTTQLQVGNGGVLNANDVAFSLASSATGLFEVGNGGQLDVSDSSIAVTQFNLDSGSNDTLSTDLVSGPFTINSGATINIAYNDFSNIGTNGLLAVGSPSATIHLENNYWGTTISSLIAAKIEDHSKDATRPTVSYVPYLTEHPVQTAAAAATVVFSTSAPNVTLSATVSSPGAIVNEGSVTFTILNGATVVGTPVSANVVSGAASANYVLPAGTTAGSYTIQAVYNGTSNYLPNTDASHVLTISAAATATAAAAASATFNSGAQTVALERHRDQRGGHGQRGDRDLHHPQRHGGRRQPRHCQRRQRHRRRQLYVAGRRGRRSLHHPGRLQRQHRLPRFHRRRSRPDDQRRRQRDRRRQRLGHLQFRRPDGRPERDGDQRRGHGQRGDRDVHDPQRHDGHRHGGHRQRRQRRRRRQLHVAGRRHRRFLHDPGRLQRHGRFPRLHR